MKNNITRRDFLNGTQVAIGASLLSPWSDVFGADPEKFALGADYYPPATTGLRGSHDGSWETMHAKVAGATWVTGLWREMEAGALRRRRVSDQGRTIRFVGASGLATRPRRTGWSPK